MWADWYERGKKFVAFYGFWDFKNSFIGSGAPYDGTALALSGFSTKCWRNVDTGVVVQDQTGAHQNLGWLKSSGHQRSIFGVHDRTRAFVLLNDMGMAWIEMRKDKSANGCAGRKSGAFYYEHNQGGNGGWSGSVSLRVFSISYSGNGGLRLQKAAKISYYP